MTPPVEIPKDVPKVEALPSTQNLPEVTAETDPGPSGDAGIGSGDAVNGVVGGVEGGVAGGVVGGEIGGVKGGEIGGVLGGQIGGVVGGVVGGKVGGTGTGTEGEGTGSDEDPPSGPLRVGGDVKAPVAIDRVEPEYTEAARKAKVAGIVVVEAIIDRNGRVQDVKVVKDLPMGLSAQAEAAVRRWRFKPGTLNGKPVATIFNLTVNFKLH
jgi:protein TonB